MLLGCGILTSKLLGFNMDSSVKCYCHYIFLQLHLNPVHAAVQLRPSMQYFGSGALRKKNMVHYDEGAVMEEKIVGPSKKQVNLFIFIFSKVIEVVYSVSQIVVGAYLNLPCLLFIFDPISRYLYRTEIEFYVPYRYCRTSRWRS